MQAYKCFNKGLINLYGRQYEIGKLYHDEGDISFGDKKHGFHVCKNLEDTFRFFDGFHEELDVCLVECFGKYAKMASLALLFVFIVPILYFLQFVGWFSDSDTMYL